MFLASLALSLFSSFELCTLRPIAASREPICSETRTVNARPLPVFSKPLLLTGNCYNKMNILTESIIEAVR